MGYFMDDSHALMESPSPFTRAHLGIPLSPVFLFPRPHLNISSLVLIHIPSSVLTPGAYPQRVLCNVPATLSLLRFLPVMVSLSFR